MNDKPGTLDVDIQASATIQVGGMITKLGEQIRADLSEAEGGIKLGGMSGVSALEAFNQFFDDWKAHIDKTGDNAQVDGVNTVRGGQVYVQSDAAFTKSHQ